MKALTFLLAVVSLLAVPTLQKPSFAQSQRTEVCVGTSEKEIASLFDRWNESLQTNDPKKVVVQYAERSMLLPTVSKKARLTPEEKEHYFKYFLKSKPSGHIDSRMIEINCNTAIDVGLYTFTFGKTGTQVKARYTFTYKWNGKEWLITSHHSSALPESE